jgi:SAM-dependent methyltransferase
VLVANLQHKPTRETDFGIRTDRYRRKIYQCQICSVYYNQQDMLGPDIYWQSYNEATYRRKLADTYLRIRSLPESQSDNKQRVRRVMDFSAQRGRLPEQTSILDVGSGLCVFLGELKEHGFVCYCIDPDPLSVQHALDYARVDSAHMGTLDDYRTGRQFDIISFNKVLEHVPDPARILSLARPLLAPGGCIYVELPDGAAALAQGGSAVDREEFYIEHYTVFTPQALEFLSRATALTCLELGRLHEPSDKYTLFSFLSSGTPPEYGQHLEAN